MRTEIHIFVMTLGYSRRDFALDFSRELPDLLATHKAAFAHSGSRCEFLLHDRLARLERPRA
ncbi:MAG: hypothetical protein N3D71_01915 [Burkholderiaceae bacterium]|nr:hypothetical protein [Burkholderiaceae bacterium]